MEAQLVDIFFQEANARLGSSLPDPTDQMGAVAVDLCTYIRAYWQNANNNPLPDVAKNGKTKEAAKWLADVYPTTQNWPEELLLLPGAINGLKAKVPILFPLF